MEALFFLTESLKSVLSKVRRSTAVRSCFSKNEILTYDLDDFSFFRNSIASHAIVHMIIYQVSNPNNDLLVFSVEILNAYCYVFDILI